MIRGMTGSHYPRPGSMRLDIFLLSFSRSAAATLIGRIFGALHDSAALARPE